MGDSIIWWVGFATIGMSFVYIFGLIVMEIINEVLKSYERKFKTLYYTNKNYREWLKYKNGGVND